MKKQDNAPRKLQPPQLTRGRIVSIAVSLLVLALLVGFGVYLNTPGADDIPTSASQMTFAVALSLIHIYRLVRKGLKSLDFECF